MRICGGTIRAVLAGDRRYARWSAASRRRFTVVWDRADWSRRVPHRGFWGGTTETVGTSRASRALSETASALAAPKRPPQPPAISRRRGELRKTNAAKFTIRTRSMSHSCWSATSRCSIAARPPAVARSIDSRVVASIARFACRCSCRERDPTPLAGPRGAQTGHHIFSGNHVQCP